MNQTSAPGSSVEGEEPKSFSERGPVAQNIYDKMGLAAFGIDPSNGGSAFYGKIRCEHSTMEKDEHSCRVVEIDRGEWKRTPESAATKRQRGSGCVITGTDPVLHFVKSKKRLDDEYETIEAVSYKELSFYLRAGHGVARLEAWNGERILANTFYRVERDTDSLRLAIYDSSSGEEIEAQCDNLDSIIP
ncbi:MAG: hypothetical protein C5B49_14045 [Bdellovibrio sp.]|nr:MAG: hypothetical protein C5B49_14045 [Bdellovibrio sp.]